MSSKGDKDDLRILLEELKLERYYEILFDAGYETNEDIITMELDDIKDLDIKIPHRKRILGEVEKLKKKMESNQDNSQELKNSTNENSDVKKEEMNNQMNNNNIPNINNNNSNNNNNNPINLTNIPNNQNNLTNNTNLPILNQDLPKMNAPMNALVESKGNQTFQSQKQDSQELNQTTINTPKQIPKIILNEEDRKKNIMDILSSFNPINLTPKLINNTTPNINLSNKNLSVMSNPPTETKKIDKQELKRLNSLLLNSCQMGNIESAKRYIEQGADDIEKSLACASSGGHKKLALFLIEMGAKDYNKAFLSACKSGNLEMMLEFYKRGANNLDEGLKEAKQKNHKNLVFQLEKLMNQNEQQVDPKKIEVENVLTLRQMNSLLLNYSQIGNFEMVKKYVEGGASNLDKALCCACSGGQKAIVEYLITKGAKDFDSAFLTSCKSGNREMALEMIKKGAKNLQQGYEIAKKRENEDMQYDIRVAMLQNQN